MGRTLLSVAFDFGVEVEDKTNNKSKINGNGQECPLHNRPSDSALFGLIHRNAARLALRGFLSLRLLNAQRFVHPVVGGF